MDVSACLRMFLVSSCSGVLSSIAIFFPFEANVWAPGAIFGAMVSTQIAGRPRGKSLGHRFVVVCSRTTFLILVFALAHFVSFLIALGFSSGQPSLSVVGTAISGFVGSSFIAIAFAIISNKPEKYETALVIVIMGFVFGMVFGFVYNAFPNVDSYLALKMGVGYTVWQIGVAMPMCFGGKEEGRGIVDPRFRTTR